MSACLTIPSSWRLTSSLSAPRTCPWARIKCSTCSWHATSLIVSTDIGTRTYFQSPQSFEVRRPSICPHQPAETARVMSLRDPTKKMSKSDPIAAGRLSLLDTDDEIALKLQRAKTDSLPGVQYDRARRPEVANLIDIYAALSNRSGIVFVYRLIGTGCVPTLPPSTSRPTWRSLRFPNSSFNSSPLSAP